MHFPNYLSKVVPRCAASPCCRRTARCVARARPGQFSEAEQADFARQQVPVDGRDPRETQPVRSNGRGVLVWGVFGSPLRTLS